MPTNADQKLTANDTGNSSPKGLNIDLLLFLVCPFIEVYTCNYTKCR